MLTSIRYYLFINIYVQELDSKQFQQLIEIMKIQHNIVKILTLYVNLRVKY